LRTGPPPPLEWLSFPPLVAAMLITPKSAESPGSGRIGVIGALGFFLSEAVGARGGGVSASAAARTLDRTRVMRTMQIGECHGMSWNDTPLPIV